MNKQELRKQLNEVIHAYAESDAYDRYWAVANFLNDKVGRTNHKWFRYGCGGNERCLHDVELDKAKAALEGRYPSEPCATLYPALVEYAQNLLGNKYKDE